MALIQMTCYSSSLSMTVDFNLIIPQSTHNEIGITTGESKKRYPVLWLLHGATDDHTTWLRRTSIERYAAEYNLAVVLPNGHLSSYVNMAHGNKFYDYITRELPSLIYKLFPISSRREDNFIAGNSMGGYGAMMIGINNPDHYGAIGCFSAAIRGPERIKKVPQNLFRDSIANDMEYLQFGDTSIAGTIWDTYYMAEKNKKLTDLPRIFHSIGNQDFLLEEAHKTRDFFMNMEGNPYKYVYEEHEGIHEWDYWDAHIVDFLKFLHLENSNS